MNRCESFSSSSEPASHRYTVGLSADISTASAFLTGLCFVFLLYHRCFAIDEESLNEQKRKYYQKANAARGGIC